MRTIKIDRNEMADWLLSEAVKPGAVVLHFADGRIRLVMAGVTAFDVDSEVIAGGAANIASLGLLMGERLFIIGTEALGLTGEHLPPAVNAELEMLSGEWGKPICFVPALPNKVSPRRNRRQRRASKTTQRSAAFG